MRTVQYTEAKNRFSSILKDIENGNEVAISYGKDNRTIAVITSYDRWKKKQKRKIGTLEGKMSVEFSNHFSITDEELINL